MDAKKKELLPTEYYVHRKGSYLGNAPMWWAKDGRGYTAYILGAERFSKEDAEKLVRGDSNKWAIYPCAEVDKRLHLVFDSQDVKRLGTDEPCGWPSGYAALAQPAQGEVDGWKLVPVEPTDEMKLAAQTEYNVMLWKAMMNAAPKVFHDREATRDDLSASLIDALKNHIPYRDESGVIGIALHDYGRILQLAEALEPRPPADTIAVPVAEYEAMKRDAGRYRFYRDPANDEVCCDICGLNGSTLDTRIDLAIEAQLEDASIESTGEDV